ncbi:hypothetical protein COCNU_12G001130 [Cocos nucifera]|uniref:Uncharacterized protein n=1 Tax=Cocos nucifera TaxID=13894 RepID=A0A8K0IRC3_COCNU|nr:hypothetical protein COCNU_12G001130 [Cocos nucifera]
MAKFEKALKLRDVAVRATEYRVELIQAKVEEKKARAIIEAKLKGIKEFKNLAEFENKIVKDSDDKSGAFVLDEDKSTPTKDPTLGLIKDAVRSPVEETPDHSTEPMPKDLN